MTNRINHGGAQNMAYFWTRDTDIEVLPRLGMLINRRLVLPVWNQGCWPVRTTLTNILGSRPIDFSAIPR